MLIQRKRRLYFILLLILSISVAVGLGLFALRQNVNLYYTPQEILKKSIATKHTVRLGGMVVKNSVKYQVNSLKVQFSLTDYQATVLVEYEGILPSLFREGQGIVAQGKMNEEGTFIANQVLAKHDAEYRPPAITRRKESL